MDEDFRAVLVEGHRRNHLGSDPSVVADFVKRGHDRWPIHIAGKQVAESINGPHVAAVIFKVNALDP